MARAVLATLSRLRRGSWLRQGTWSVLDQALFAGANFLVNVLLARWLSPEAYGAFTVAFMVFLLAGTVHQGLLVEPMLVFGPERFKGRTGAYLRALLAGHGAYALVAGALLGTVAGVAWALGSPEFGALFGTLAVAQGAILALWLMRRACYVVSRPEWAAGAGALYLALLVTGAVGLYHVEALTGPAALALMAATSLVAAVVLAVRLGVPLRPAPPDLAADVRAAHLGYGRWAAPTGGMEWVQAAIPYLALPVFVGLEGSATLRALYNLAMPALMGFTALATLSLPVFVRARADGTLRRTVRDVSLAFGGLSVTYGVLLVVFGGAVMDWLYAGKYPVGTAALVLLGLAPLGVGMSNLLMSVLRSAERPAVVFGTRAAAVGTKATIGLAVMAWMGVVGALLSDLISLLTELAMLLRPASRELRDGASGPASAAPVDGERSPDRLRVLVSAFACTPGEGSEGGVGWHTVRSLARHHDVTVITYEGTRIYVEAELAERPVEGLTVEYVALPFERERHRVHGEPFASDLVGQIHYVLWQGAVKRRARRLHAERPFDLAHHVTYVKYWAPSGLAGLGVPFVWGPVGGGEAAPPAFVDVLGPDGARYERRRAAAQRLFERMPSVRRTARAADVAFATTEPTRARMEALGARDVEVRSAIGIPREEADRLGSLPAPGEGPARFVCVGRQIAWKGYRFAVEAFAAAAAGPALDGAELWLIGDGPERESLRALAADLGVAARVRFWGQLTRDEVFARLGEAHVLVQPSLHDSGGGVCLEALAAGRPVVGFALGGTVLHAPPEAARLVPAETPEQATAALADAMRELAADPALRRRLGDAGRRIVAERFVWDVRAAEWADRYWAVAGRVRPPVPAPAAPPVETEEPVLAWT